MVIGGELGDAKAASADGLAAAEQEWKRGLRSAQSDADGRARTEAQVLG